MNKTKRGMTPRYTKTVAREINDHICQGKGYEDLRLSNPDRYPRVPMIHKWCVTYPEFGNDYYQASQLGVLYLLDELVSIADTPLPPDKELCDRELKHRALRISARKSKISVSISILTKQATKVSNILNDQHEAPESVTHQSMPEVTCVDYSPSNKE